MTCWTSLFHYIDLTKVDTRKVVFLGNFLSTKMLLDYIQQRMILVRGFHTIFWFFCKFTSDGIVRSTLDKKYVNFSIVRKITKPRKNYCYLDSWIVGNNHTFNTAERFWNPVRDSHEIIFSTIFFFFFHSNLPIHASNTSNDTTSRNFIIVQVMTC